MTARTGRRAGKTAVRKRSRIMSVRDLKTRTKILLASAGILGATGAHGAPGVP
jgi:hypothetical protein